MTNLQLKLNSLIETNRITCIIVLHRVLYVEVNKSCWCQFKWWTIKISDSIEVDSIFHKFLLCMLCAISDCLFYSLLHANFGGLDVSAPLLGYGGNVGWSLEKTMFFCIWFVGETFWKFVDCCVSHHKDISTCTHTKIFWLGIVLMSRQRRKLMVSFMECSITMYNLINGRKKKHRFLCYTYETRAFHHDVCSFSDHNFLSSLDVILVIYFYLI